MFKRGLIGIAIASALTPPASATDYSSTIFFGDSLTDAGYFGSRFTTNPSAVWAEDLAARLGRTALAATPGSTGTDYAQGGARITVPDGQESLTGQVNRYLAGTGGKADPHALYTVWGGANDAFYAASSLGGDVTAITNLVLQTTGEQVALVQRLIAAGARYVLVPNLPDLGATPLGTSVGSAGAAALTSLASNYNAALFGKLSAAGVNAIPLDTFNLLREVRANPGAYKIKNATDRACGSVDSSACFPANYVTPTANVDYAFADDVHPTTAAHVILADYAYSMLVAPQQIGQLAETPVRTRSALSNQLLDQGMESPTRPHRVWATASGGKLQYTDSPEFGGADGSPYSLTAGFDTGVEHGGLGLALNLSGYRPDFGNNGGHYTQNEVSASLYGGVLFGQLGVAFVGTLGHISYDTTRSVKLGPATRDVEGSTEGSNISAAVQAQYQLQAGRLTHGPLVGVTAQRVQVRGFNESAANGVSTALSFGTQTRASVIGRLAYQVAYDASGFIPYGRIGVEHDFVDSTDRDIEVGLPSVYSGSYRLPAGKVDPTAATLQLGSRFLISPQLGAWVEFNGSFGRKNIDDYNLSAGVRYAF